MIKHRDSQLSSIRSYAYTVPFMLALVACNGSGVSSQQDGGNGGNGGPSLISAQFDSVTNQCFSTSASLVGLSGTSISCSGNASVQGSVVLMGSSTLQLSGNAAVTDTVYAESVSNVIKNGHPTVGSFLQEDLSDHEPAVVDFANEIGKLDSTQVFDSIDADTDITGNGGVNIIEVTNGINVSGQVGVRLHGTIDDQFVFVVKNGGVTISGNAGVEPVGSVSSRKVLFVVEGSQSLSITGNGSISGTFLIPNGPAQISGNGKLDGAVIAQGSIQISGNGVSFTPAAWCPQIVLPAPSPSPSAAPSVSPSTSPSSSPTVSPSASPSASPTTSPSATPSATPSPSPSSCTGPFCGISTILGA